MMKTIFIDQTATWERKYNKQHTQMLKKKNSKERDMEEQ